MKTDSSTTSLYSYDQDGNLIEENNGGTVTDYIYLDGINVANWAPSEGHVYAINYDIRGVPLVARDEYGLTTWAAYSSPYGSMTVTQATGTYTGPITQNQRLAGQFYDKEDALHYNGFRDYLPGVGRYIEADPSGLRGGLNLYAYAGGQPLTSTDKRGLDNSSTNDQIQQMLDDLAQLHQSIQETQDEFDNAIQQFGQPGGNVASGGPQSSILSDCTDCVDVAESTSLPIVGPPSTWAESSTGQSRYYDSNGNAMVDIDNHFDHGAGTPHIHYWNGNVRGPAIPLPLP